MNKWQVNIKIWQDVRHKDLKSKQNYLRYATISNRLVTLHVKMSFASFCRLTDWETSEFYVCVYEFLSSLMQLHFKKLYYVDMYWQKLVTFNSFIPTMQFVEKQHNSTLKALVLFAYMYFWYNIRIVLWWTKSFFFNFESI